MPLRRWALLQLIKGDVNVLKPFMCFLNKEIDQLFESALQLLDLSHPDKEKLAD